MSLRIEDAKKGTNMKHSIVAKILAAVPVWAVSSYDPAGKPDVMTAAWVGIYSGSRQYFELGRKSGRAFDVGRDIGKQGSG